MLAHKLRRAGSGPTAFDYVVRSTSTASTITLPDAGDGAAEGDLCILCDMPRQASSTPTLVTPAGWSGIMVDTVGSWNLQLRITAKILTGDDLGAVVTGSNGSGNNQKMALVFRPNAPIGSFSAGEAFLWTVGNLDPAAQTINADLGTQPLISLGIIGVDTSGAADFSSVSLDFEAEYEINRMRVGYSFDAVSRTVDAVDIGSQINLCSGFIQAAA